jgi:hypothetical protein
MADPPAIPPAPQTNSGVFGSSVHHPPTQDIVTPSTVSQERSNGLLWGYPAILIESYLFTKK